MLKHSLNYLSQLPLCEVRGGCGSAWYCRVSCNEPRYLQSPPPRFRRQILGSAVRRQTVGLYSAGTAFARTITSLLYCHRAQIALHLTSSPCHLLCQL
jgi:hypothetical protein